MANNRRGRTSEGGPLRRSAPSVGRFASEICPREPVLRFGEPAPLLSIGRGSRWKREFGVGCSGRLAPRAVYRPFPSLFAAHRRFRRWAAWKFEWRDPFFQTHHSPPRPDSRRSRLFRASDLWIGQRKVPSAQLPRSWPISVGAIAVSPASLIAGEPAPSLLHRPRGPMETGIGGEASGRLAPRALSRRFPSLLAAHRRFRR